MIRLLTEGQVAYGSKTTATAASGNELSPVVLAVIIGIALGAFVFYGICKVGRMKGEKSNTYFLEGIYRFVAVICLLLVMSFCIGIAVAVMFLIQNKQKRG